MDPRLQAFERLLNIMDDLREKCPWDRKQTLESLRHLTIEETYELTDAILDNDMNELKGELGDLMLHLVFYSKIADEQKAFNITDVLNTICDKLVHRHPHVYGDAHAASEDEVKSNWEELKLKEGKKSALEGVPKSLQAMIKASRIQDKAAGLGFDWEDQKDVWDKVIEEQQELEEAVKKQNKENQEEELGDLFFAMINYSRFLNIEAEAALERTNKKFIKRFQWMENRALESDRSLTKMSLQEMESLWQASKKFDDNVS